MNGCEGGGPYWEWLPEQPDLGPLDRDTLAQIANDDPPQPATEAASSSSGEPGGV